MANEDQNDAGMSKDMREVFYEAMITGDVSQSIMNQEIRGQSNLVNSEILPIKFNYCSKEQFESMGIVFGDYVDDLFVNVTVPEGWKKERTDHSMWSKLIDDKGRERASIFYKAAFYDRDAFMNIVQRFTCRTQPVGGYGNREETRSECVVTDCGVIVWKSDPIELPCGDNSYADRNKIEKTLRVQGEAWLDEHYSEWHDPLAHWD